MICIATQRISQTIHTMTSWASIAKRNIPSTPNSTAQRTASRVRRVVNARKLLWLFSQKANVFPGKARHGTARWLIDPTNLCPAPVFDPNVYTKSMVFFNLRACRGTTDDREGHTTKPVFLVGAMGGRDETGICVVQQLKQNGDAATIRWLLTAQQLREMERVVFVSDYCPFRGRESDYDSDCYGYDDW